MNQLLNLLLPWPWRDEINWTTDLFVYGIFIFFIIGLSIFLLQILRRGRRIKNLIDAPDQDNYSTKREILNHLIEKFKVSPELAEVWKEFENSLITRDSKENGETIVYKTDEASVFFSEERLIGQYMNLRFWNSVPALLVGLGILGTFIGLVAGLIPFSNINFEETEDIQTAIQGLLSGVSTAFVTSVWGMLFSILFNWAEKLCLGWVSRQIAVLQRALDQLFTLKTQEEISYRQEDELAQQTQALKAFSTDLADKIKIVMDNIMSQRLENLDSHLENLTANTQTIVAELQKSPETIAKDIDNIMSKSKALEHLDSHLTNLKLNTQNIVGQIENVNQLLLRLQQQNTQETQEIVAELKNSPETISSALAEKLMPSLNSLNQAVTELQKHKEESSTDAIQRLVDEFQTSLSGSASAQMEALAETVSEVSQSLITLPENLNNIMAGIQEQVQQMSGSLSETSQAQEVKIKEMMAGMLSAFEAAIDTHQAGLSATTDNVNEEMQKIANDIRDLLESTALHTDAQLKQRTTDMEKVSAQSIEALQTTIDKLQNSMTTTASQVAENSEEMTNRMHQLVDQSTDSLGLLLQQQAHQIDAVNSQIDNSRKTLEKSTETLQQIDASVTNVRQLIETTKNLSGQLTVGTENLKTAGEKLIQAGETFNKENAEYLESNREIIEILEGMFEESQDLLNKFAERFATIDNGLQSIFGEIQRGLENYSVTTRDTTRQYLNEFTDQFTQAAEALAGGVEALTDSCEELTDMMEKLI